MKTYLDHEFWERFGIHIQAIEDDLKQEAWLNFKRFLKNETDLFLNIQIDNVDQHKQLEYQIYNILTSGRGARAKIAVRPKAFRFMQGPLIFQNNFEEPDCLFLLEPKDQEHLNKWREKNGFLIQDYKSLLDSWMIYRQLDTTKFPKSFSVRPNAKFGFNLQSFDGLSIYKHPATDIIIADRYLFKSEKLFKGNLPSLIQSIIDLRSNISFSFFGSIRETFEKDTGKLKDLSLKLLSKFSDLKVEVILDDNDRFKEHDRHFITNYFYLKPGDSFSLFQDEKKFKTNGTTIDIKSLFDYSEMEAAKNTIQNLLQIRSTSRARTETLKNRLFKLAE